MAFYVLKRLKELNKKPTEELLKMADVYYASDRLTETEYEEIVEYIKA